MLGMSVWSDCPVCLLSLTARDKQTQRKKEVAVDVFEKKKVTQNQVYSHVLW